MLYTAWLLVFLSLAAYGQGFATYEDALAYLEQLEQEVEEQSNGLKLLITDGRKTLEENHDLEFRRAKARSEQNTLDFLKEAAKRKCPKHLSQEIANVGSNIEDRWQSCMNMSQKLIDFENTTLALYKAFLSWRPTICDAANNVSYCFQDKSLFNRVTCAYDGMSGYLDDFKKIKDQMVDAVKSIHELVLHTISDFKACFGSAQNTDQQTQLRILEEGCPPKRGKLISKMS